MSTYEAMTPAQKQNYAKLLNYPDAINPYDLANAQLMHRMKDGVSAATYDTLAESYDQNVNATLARPIQ